MLSYMHDLRPIVGVRSPMLRYLLSAFMEVKSSSTHKNTMLSPSSFIKNGKIDIFNPLYDSTKIGPLPFFT